jgi:hypothetical protein
VLLSTTPLLHAGQEVYTEAKGVAPTDEFPFEKGNFELQVLAGSFFSINHSPDLDYAVGTIRAGWMLNSPSGSGVLRGNVEFLIEAFGAAVIEGPGDVMAGGTLILRYNFVQPEATVVPYFQIGGGGLYNDIHEDQSQRLIGSAFEFNLQASLGVRWFLSERCAFVVEGGYRHISNANSADRNVGVDSLGGHIGFSCFY